MFPPLFLCLDLISEFYLGIKRLKFPPKGMKESPSEALYWHLLDPPFHDFLQKVRGCVVRLSLKKPIRGNYPP